MHQQLKEFVKRVCKQTADWPEPTQTQLLEIANEIRRIYEMYPFDESKYPKAGATQQFMYPIAVCEPSGPSLYLVSEAPGTTSPPHEHQTWAIIVGLFGSEINTLYQRTLGDNRMVNKAEEVVVGAGAFFCMQASDVHSTRVGLFQPTYHLHLYGRPLFHLPNFESRCFEVTPADSPARLVS